MSERRGDAANEARESVRTARFLERTSDGVATLAGHRLDNLAMRLGIATPFYAYDFDAIEAETRALVEALQEGGPNGLCAYAIKANAASPIVRAIVGAGGGIDVVSGGELRLALACEAPSTSIIYNGVAKRDDELDLAITHEIKAIHAESVEEIARIDARAKALGQSVAIGLRINPGVEADTHAHIATGHDEAKFGIAIGDLPRALAAVAASEGRLRIVGLGVHIGSQLMSPEPYLSGVDAVCALATDLRAQLPALAYLDTGGGFGVPYLDRGTARAPAEFVRETRSRMRQRGLGDLGLVIEPGRALVAAHGVLVSTVVQPKRSQAGGVERRWLLIDAGMNDLIRPALYQAHHRIEPMTLPSSATNDDRKRWPEWRIAGPVCESSDDFGLYFLPDPPPSQVVIRDVGAYGRSMASGYNARPIASEVFLRRGGSIALIRATESAPIVERIAT